MDGIMCDLHTRWCELYNKDWNDNLTIDKVTAWNMHQFCKPECGDKLYDYLTPELYLDLEPLPGAIKAYKQLKKAGHTIVFITASPKGCADAKATWLEKHLGVGYMDYGAIKRKYMVRADVLVDDSPKNIKLWKEAWPNGLGISIAYPYNEELRTLSDLHAESYKNTEVAWEQIVERIIKRSHE